MVINLYEESKTLKHCVHPLKRLAGFEHCDPTDPYPLSIVIQLLSGLDRKQDIWPEESPSPDRRNLVK